MGPLSAKQHREYLKLAAQEKREQAKMEKDESRKDQLHEIKLQEAAAKANQGIAHKEQAQVMKLREGSMEVPRVNRQKLGLPSMNPLAGTEVLGQGQKRLPGMVPQGTDTVPAMLTPGEAVIPASAAQNPKNKKAIRRMVKEGRKKNAQGFANGTTGVQYLNGGTTSADYYNSLGSEYGVGEVVAPPPVQQVPVTTAVPQPNADYYNSLAAEYGVPETSPTQPAVITTPVVPQPVIQATKTPTMKPAAAPVVAQPKVVPVVSTVSEPTLTPQQIEAAVVDKSVPEMPDQTEAETARLEDQNKLPVVPTGNLQQASQVMKSQADRVAEYMAQQGYPSDGKVKDEKGFVDSFKNIFTYSGLKDSLGFNDQEVARFALATLAGRARGYNIATSMAWAGRNAYNESAKRQAQENADKKAAMRNAITMANTDLRAEQADKRAAAKEEHDRFIAKQQEKMAEIKAEYQRTRDDQRFAQQLQVLAGQQAAADRRMQAAFGNQWALMYAREDLKANNPQAILDRRAKNVNNAAIAVKSIYERDLGAGDIKGNANPLRKGLPTPEQVGQQSLSFLKNAGVDVDNQDIYQESSALINQATEEMIRDKANGSIKAAPSIAPYLARNVITHRMGLEKELFMVGDKEMAPNKIADVYSAISKRVKDANNGVQDDRKVKDIVSAFRTEWNSDNGKRLRKQFTGTEGETAFYQFLQSKFK